MCQGDSTSWTSSEIWGRQRVSRLMNSNPSIMKNTKVSLLTKRDNSGHTKCAAQMLHNKTCSHIFLAVNTAEGEGKTDFYLLMFRNSSFSIGEYYVTNVPDFFFCGNIALCKWHTSNPIECNKMKQSVPSSMGLIYTMLMNP